jgi:hypothetical protein
MSRERVLAQSRILDIEEIEATSVNMYKSGTVMVQGIFMQFQ